MRQRRVGPSQKYQAQVVYWTLKYIVCEYFEAILNIQQYDPFDRPNLHIPPVEPLALDLDFLLVNANVNAQIFHPIHVMLTVL